MFSIIFGIAKDTSSISQYWGVTPSVSYNYNLNQVNIIYNIPPVSFNSTSITFKNDSSIQQGTTIHLNVTEVQSLNVTYELSANDLTENHFIDNETYESQIYDLLLLPLKFATKEISVNDINRGFTGIDYILVPKSGNTWDTLDGYDNPLFVAVTKEIFDQFANIYIEAHTEIGQENNSCVFEWFVNGTYFDDIETIDFTFAYNLKIAYDMTTGLLLGMRVDLSFEGFKLDDSLIIVIQSEVEREDYDLANFYLPEGNGINIDDLFSSLFPGFDWWLIPIICLALYNIGITVRKRKH